VIIQTAVEAEVSEFLGRARYERAAGCGTAKAGSRNGYCPTTIKTTAGPVAVSRPKLRGTSEVFASRLFGTGITKSNALESLVIAGFVRGLSVRDVEATIADALGAQATVSKSEVSRICQVIRDELDTWSARRLDDVELDYLFLDGSHFKYHVGAAAEPVLAAWGIDTSGKPVFVGLGAARSESGDAWADFLTDLGERGLGCPLLVISDGAPGLIGAAEQTMGAALRQRCLIHRARNLLAKVPKHAQADVKADYWAIFDVPDTIEPGPDAVAFVQARIDKFAARWRDSYPAAVRCLLADRDSLTVYLRFPREHWTRIRHSNFIERTFGETRRRVKVIGRLPGETSCLRRRRCRRRARSLRRQCLLATVCPWTDRGVGHAGGRAAVPRRGSRSLVVGPRPTDRTFRASSSGSVRTRSASVTTRSMPLLPAPANPNRPGLPPSVRSNSVHCPGAWLCARGDVYS
jgi:transposase-like protein